MKQMKCLIWDFSRSLFFVDAVVQLFELGAFATALFSQWTVFAICFTASVSAFGIAFTIGFFAFEQKFATSRHNIASPNAGDIFGYQEAWAEYRYWPSVITSLVSPSAANASVGQAYWSYATNNQMDEVSLGNFLNASFQKADVDIPLPYPLTLADSSG